MTGGWWPTPDQQLLLRAATHVDREAVARACSQWWAGIDFDRLDGASYRLVPQLHVNLRRHGLEAPDDRIRGVHRQSWYRNQLQYRMLEDVLATLTDAGVDSMVLKGAALALCYYDDIGARPMSDIDLVVPAAEARAVVALLAAHGWRPERPIDEAVLRFTHSVPLLHPDGWELDLHWFGAAGGGHMADATTWAAAERVSIGHASTRALASADELLLAFVHGLGWNVVASVRWLCDAAIVIRASAVDWERLLDQAALRRQVVPLKVGLAAVRDVMDVDVPDRVLRRTRELPVAWWEHLEHEARRRPWDVAWGTVVNHVIGYLRSRRGAGAVQALRGTPQYITWRLGLERLRDLPLALRAYVQRLQARRDDVERASVEHRGPPLQGW